MCIFHPLTFTVISSGNFIISFFVGEESTIQKIKKFINIIRANNSTQDWVLNLGMSNSKDESLNHIPSLSQVTYLLIGKLLEANTFSGW